ncbi:MAG TPA: PH domain-containing protein [Chloroflexota bacterium]|nr:PH domain-containing protein [Chloroflexota bacterium]
MLLLSLAALASVLFAIRQPVGFAMFLGLLVGLICGGLGLILLIFTYGYFALRYRFEQRALVIRWLGREEVVPYRAVDGIFAGSRLGQAMRVRGLNWPGYHVGIGRTRAMGLVRYYTTTSDLGDVALIVTPSATYALSPADVEGFRRELIRHVEDSDQPTETLDDELAVPPLPPVLRDLSLPALLFGSLALLAICLGYVWLKWDGLPDTIPLHFAADGTPNMFGPREDVFRIPAVGASILVGNLGLGLALYARERAAARMLWASALVVELLVLIATARILH